MHFRFREGGGLLSYCLMALICLGQVEVFAEDVPPPSPEVGSPAGTGAQSEMAGQGQADPIPGEGAADADERMVEVPQKCKGCNETSFYNCFDPHNITCNSPCFRAEMSDGRPIFGCAGTKLGKKSDECPLKPPPPLEMLTNQTALKVFKSCVCVNGVNATHCNYEACPCPAGARRGAYGNHWGIIGLCVIFWALQFFN